jgi:tight adherence protein B
METTTLDTQIPELLRVVEVALRSGYNIKQALEIVVKDVEEPMRSEAQSVLDEIGKGVAIPAALTNWVARTSSTDLDLVVAAFQVQFEVGGNLADKLNLLAQIFGKRTLN